MTQGGADSGGHVAQGAPDRGSARASGDESAVSNAVEIRPARLEDVDGIVAVHLRSWQATYRGGVVPDETLERLEREPPVGAWRDRVADAGAGGRFVLVACREGSIVGFVWGFPTDDDDDDPRSVGLIELFHVDPDSWGQGIGRAMISSAIEAMRAFGLGSASLWVVDVNARAQAFYEALGWRRDGTSRLDHLGMGTEAGIPVTAFRYRYAYASDW